MCLKDPEDMDLECFRGGGSKVFHLTFPSTFCCLTPLYFHGVNTFALGSLTWLCPIPDETPNRSCGHLWSSEFHGTFWYWSSWCRNWPWRGAAVERGAEPMSHRSRSWEMSVKREGSQALVVGWITSLGRNLNWGASKGPADSEAPQEGQVMGPLLFDSSQTFSHPELPSCAVTPNRNQSRWKINFFFFFNGLFFYLYQRSPQCQGFAQNEERGTNASLKKAAEILKWSGQTNPKCCH